MNTPSSQKIKIDTPAKSTQNPLRIALAELRAIGAWVPIDVDPFVVACQAIEAADKCDSIAEMRAACLDTMLGARLGFLDNARAENHIYRAAVLLMGLREFDGDESLARDFSVGYFFNRDAQGKTLTPENVGNKDAWEAGCSADVLHAAHLIARKEADAAFLEKFGGTTGDEESHTYWIDQYYAAFSTASRSAIRKI